VDSTALVTLLAEGAVLVGAGAAAGVSEVVTTAVTDAYQACKKAVRRLFGDDEDAKEKLGQLEVKPDDQRLIGELRAFVESHRAVEDPVVLKTAAALRNALADAGPVVGSISGTFTADRGGIAAAVITGGASTSYSPGREADDPR
jgi:hypothetical protein